MDFGAATHPGYVRSGNEDGFFASCEHAVFAVADGMGGHAQGEVASHLALETVARFAEALSQAAPGELANDLHMLLQEANTVVISQASEQEARNRMGTTMVVAAICGDRLYFAHIGDSRLYLLRGEAFSQLTRDHSLVQSMVDRGEISAEEAAIHPLRHQITRVIGSEQRVSPEIASQALESGDLLLLCTDGLSGAVSTDLIKQILSTPGLSTQEQADALIQAALDAGGPDNITAVVVAYHHPRPLPQANEFKSEVRKGVSFFTPLLVTLCSIVVFTAAIGLWMYANPSYLIAVNGRGELALYRNWPFLPMLQREEVPTTLLTPVRYEDAVPYIAPYQPKTGSIRDGILVKGAEVGDAMLHDMAQATASGMLQDAKTSLEEHDLTRARDLLSRAKEMQADPLMIEQLEAQAQKLAERPRTLERPR